MSLRASPLAALVLASCSEIDPPDDDDDRDALRLLARVRDDGYPSWTSESIEGSAPHGAFSTIFLDPTMDAALAGPAIERWPEGATIVCEGRDAADGDVVLLMIMRRQYDAWWWGQYDADDAALVYGRQVGCVHCHAAGDDFTRAVAFP